MSLVAGHGCRRLAAPSKLAAPATMLRGCLGFMAMAVSSLLSKLGSLMSMACTRLCGRPGCPRAHVFDSRIRGPNPETRAFSGLVDAQRGIADYCSLGESTLDFLVSQGSRRFAVFELHLRRPTHLTPLSSRLMPQHASVSRSSLADHLQRPTSVLIVSAVQVKPYRPEQARRLPRPIGPVRGQRPVP